MKFTILGCGTSSGVPRIGNDWGECDPAEPKNRRMRCALLAEIAGKTILVDCGPDLRAQLLAANVQRIDHLIVTHDHADHCHGIDDLRPLAQAAGAPLPLYARAHVLDRLRRRFGYVFEGGALYRPILDPVVIERDWPNIRFVDQPHGGITSLGLRFDHDGKSCGYAIDFHELTLDMAELYRGLDLWIADCLRRRPHPSHAHLDAVLGWARELGVGQLLLTHLDNSMDFAALATTLPSWAQPAFDGQEISLA
ncbi:MBL fold metallo-hydrolase [Sphingomonas mesophila]|uniref:MBL fold metallo-hydrolase n=1 Tax=Sphingomonas mesophila TaxID=2303576 RepID=UPI000E593373|nr:MBL fold metallo-hydrolase [Sphingomonas mesophila]